MQTRKLYILGVVLYTSILISCTQSLDEQSVSTPVPTHLNVDVLQSNPTPISTEFSLLCEMTGLESLATYVTDLNGILAYVVPEDTYWKRGKGQSGIIGGTPIQARLFPSVSNIDVIGFSPDNNWFAYTRPSGQPGRTDPFIYLLSSQGQTIKTPMTAKAEDETLFWFATWISNNYMMIQFNKIPSGFGSGTYVVDSYALINVFTSEEHEDLSQTLEYWNRWTTPYFSPDMTRAVYVTDSHSPMGTSLVLWDTEQQTILWSKPFRSIFGVEENYIGDRGFSQTAFWSADSSQFVFTTGEVVSENATGYSSYLVDRDGVTERLLVSSSTFSDVMVLGGLWSSDGRFIYYFHGNSFVYDLDSDQAIDLCANYSTYVAWSPDSTYFAYVGKVDQELHLLLFNIYTGEVSSVGVIEDVVGLAWILNEEWLIIPDER